MSDPVFSIGIVTPASKYKKRVKRPIKKTTRTRICGEPVLRAWFILPASPDPIVQMITSSIGQSLKAAKEKIKEMSSNLKCKSWATYRLLGVTEQHLKHVFWLCQKNDRVRKSLTKLLIYWRRRHLIRANEEDLITMDPPVKRVDLYDWTQNRIYTFEANTIFRCLTKRLTTHDGMFATPLEPVNPYTNMKLTIGQLHSVLEQLRSYGLSHWTTEALRNVRYCWTEFTVLHDTALQMGAMRSVFSDLKSTEFHDTLFDFIDAEYINNDADIDTDMYRWLIKHAIESDHMSQWRRLCYDFYKNQILYKDLPLKQKMVKIKIAMQAALLCRMPRELYQMRNRMEAIEITGEA